jgi:hypothetical protein
VNALKSLTLITSLLLLSGCTTFSLFGSKDVEPVVVQTQAVERTPLNLPDPSPIEPINFKWIVITPENAEDVWKKLEEQGSDLVLFAVTDEGYEALSINMVQIRNHIDKQHTILLKYREYYESEKQE